MDEKYCGLLAEHENYPLKSLFCMYLVQTPLSLAIAGVRPDSFIMMGRFKLTQVIWRTDKLQTFSQSK
ncbi:MAG TPA: hypothetical protein VF717_05665 [Pyrinomonadaceae bacterium]|jgi:hypothetical protein